MKILFDANVWVSSYHKPGSVCWKGIAACGRYGLRPCVTRMILVEIERALVKKMRWTVAEAKLAAEGAEEGAEMILESVPGLWHGLPDPDDAHILDAAIFAGVGMVVTGDKKLAAYGTDQLRIPFVTPAKFLEIYS